MYACPSRLYLDTGVSVSSGCSGVSCSVMSNVYNYIKNIILFLMMALSLGSCFRESTNVCYSLRVRIKAVVAEEQKEIKPEDIKTLKLFIYDASNGELISILETAMNRKEKINFPGVEKLHLVAVANAERHLSPEDSKAGAHMKDATLSLEPGDVFGGMQLYECPDDLCWGELEIMNDATAETIFELPLKRVVGGLHIRIRGLKDFNNPATKSPDDNYSVVLGVPYNKVDFGGQPFYSSAGTGDRIYHRVRGVFRVIDGVEFYEIPELEKYFNILASDEGADMTLSIYRGDTPLVADIASGIVNGKHGLLTAYNGRNHLIDVDLSAAAGVTVTLTVGAWHKVPLPEVSF